VNTPKPWASTDDALVELMDMPIEHIRYLIDMAGTAVSLSETSQSECRITTLFQIEAKTLLKLADVNLSREAMREAFRKLDVREQQIMFLRHHEGLRVKRDCRGHEHFRRESFPDIQRDHIEAPGYSDDRARLAMEHRHYGTGRS
jgi:hypothetical protein